MEVHVQLGTRSKMFCGCPTDYLGKPPNANVCPICLGMPGMLPVVNRRAVELCVRTALALNCEIQEFARFDRKNYFYPDLPKGYQISQYDLPFGLNGWLEVGGKRVRIRRVHLEEDTGKLVHAGDSLSAADRSYVDLNRSGMPLMEIVTEPDLGSAGEARDYAVALRAILRSIGASEADMEKGQLRAEPNVSIRPVGASELGVKTELKNLNSFRAVLRGVEFEIERQAKVLDAGGAVTQETRGWSEAEQRTFGQRSKEFAEDYRYFPEPDLPPLRLERAWIEEQRSSLPELPAAHRARLVAQLGLPQNDARLIVEGGVGPVLEAAQGQGADARATANWLVAEVLPQVTDWADQLSARQVAGLVGLVESRKINRDFARKTQALIFSTDLDPETVAREQGWLGMVDDDVIRNAIHEVRQIHPQAVADFEAGKQQAIGVLIKAVREATGGMADPKRVNELLREALTR